MKNLVTSVNTLKYMSTFMILSVLLLPKFPLLSVPGTFVSIRIEDIIVLATATLYLLYLITTKEIFGYRVTRHVLIYLAVGFISLLSAIFLTNSAEFHIGVLHWIRRIEYILPMFIGISLVTRDKSNLGYFIKLFILVVVYAFLYGLGQRYLSWPIILTQNLEYSKGISLKWVEGSHINSTFAGHYDLAAYLVLVLPLVVVMFAKSKDWISRIILGFVGIGGFWLLGYAASRISIVSYLFSVSLTLILVKKYRYILPVLILSVLVFGLSSNLKSRYDNFFAVFVDRISNSISENVDVYASDKIIPEKRESAAPTPTPTPVFEDRSTSIRLKASWPKSFRAIEKNPILGTGYSSVTLAVDNNYLRVLAEEGILGFVAWTLLFVGIARSFVDVFPFIKNLKKTELLYVSSIASSTLGVFIIAVFIDIFLASKFAITFWFCIGLALGVIKNAGKEI